MEPTELTGTYRLLSWENHYKSGAITYPFGPDAEGYIVYTPSGHVSAHLMAANRPSHAINNIFDGDPEDFKNSGSTHFSYFGTYEIQGNKVLHQVSICSFPNWIDSLQTRVWSFENGNLKLKALDIPLGDETVDNHLVWQPVNG